MGGRLFLSLNKATVLQMWFSSIIFNWMLLTFLFFVIYPFKLFMSVSNICASVSVSFSITVSVSDRASVYNRVRIGVCVCISASVRDHIRVHVHAHIHVPAVKIVLWNKKRRIYTILHCRHALSNVIDDDSGSLPGIKYVNSGSVADDSDSLPVAADDDNDSHLA